LLEVSLYLVVVQGLVKKKAPAGCWASSVSVTSIAVGMELLCNANLVYLLEDKRFEGLTGKYRGKSKAKADPPLREG
jgi:hypothetical protein